MVAYIVDEEQNKDLKIIEIGMPTRESSSREWGPGVREYYMVHIIFSGEGYFNGKHLSQGDFFVTSPYQKIHYYPKKENPWNYIWILLKGDSVIDFLSKYGFVSQNGVGHCAKMEEIKKITEAFFVEHYFTISAKTATNWVNLIFSYNVDSDKVKDTNIKQRHLSRATDYIENNYHAGISPKDVAKFVGLDEKYLYSLFKNFLKISMQDYLNNLRIEKGKFLL